MSFLQIIQHVKNKLLARGVMFALILAFLVTILFTIIRTNSIVEKYGNEDFAIKRESRMVFQIRSQIMQAFGACHEAVHSSHTSHAEWSEKCLTSIEAALSLVSNDYKSIDPQFLQNELNSILEIAEKIVALSEKPNDQNSLDSEILKFEKKVNNLYTKLGEVEAKLWGDGTERYSQMLIAFKATKRFEFISVFLVICLCLYLYLLSYFKERADKELEKAREKLEVQKLTLIQSSRLSALGEMATGIAHEINNPLAVIQVKAEKLSRLSSSEKLTKENLDENILIIMSMSRRITKIIKGLRVFARDGESDPFVESEIGAIIDETLEISKLKITNSSVRLEVVIPTPTLTLECNPTQISQVIFNLINNAVDAIENLPTVPDYDKWIRIEVSDLDNYVKITVVDCGNGIPYEVQEKMFTPFYTTKEVGKGMGLGLSISAGIIKAHSGKLEIDQDTANTSISFTLPKKTTQPNG